MEETLGGNSFCKIFFLDRSGKFLLSLNHIYHPLYSSRWKQECLSDMSNFCQWYFRGLWLVCFRDGHIWSLICKLSYHVYLYGLFLFLCVFLNFYFTSQLHQDLPVYWNSIGGGIYIYRSKEGKGWGRIYKRKYNWCDDWWAWDDSVWKHVTNFIQCTCQGNNAYDHECYFWKELGKTSQIELRKRFYKT